MDYYKLFSIITIVILNIITILLAISALQRYVEGEPEEEEMPDPGPPPTEFEVTVNTKTPNNPQYGVGNLRAFYLNGEETPALTFKRGVKYTFHLYTPGYPFYISESRIGEATAVYTNRVFGTGSTEGKLVFKPDDTTPSTLFYQSMLQKKYGMGNKYS